MWIRAVLCTLLFILSGCGGSDTPPPAASTTPSSEPPPATNPPATNPPPTNPPPSNPPPTSGPAGPWPTADLTIYAAAQSLNGTVIDASPDEAQNIWACL